MKESKGLFDAFAEEITEDVSDLNAKLEYEMLLLEISKAIVQYRKENHLTQKQLAEKLQVQQVMVSKLEKGTYNPTIKQLYTISRKLDNSSDWYIRLLKEMIQSLYRNQNIRYSMYEVYQYHLNERNKKETTYQSKNKKKYVYVGGFYDEESRNTPSR